ncbi:hypothetical protein CF65_00354 [Aggregatibacter actinomycetemcomitans HK1651]|nr:hypothetical protein CF65_00354 [Aggregatibacter actinomycetemcomitans HK1651]
MTHNQHTIIWANIGDNVLDTVLDDRTMNLTS